ncbi:MAG: hypothetical protein ABFD91_01185 [Anaerohalosphaeraceae bacterium]
MMRRVMILAMAVGGVVLVAGAMSVGDDAKIKEAEGLLRRAEEIVLRIEKATGYRTPQGYDVSEHEQLRAAIEEVVRSVDSPVILREVFYTARFRYQSWCRVCDRGPETREGSVFELVQSGVLGRLAAIGSESSYQVLMDLFVDTDLSWDAAAAYAIGGSITRCGKGILPHLEQYVKQGGQRVELAKELIECIRGDKIYGL